VLSFGAIMDWRCTRRALGYTARVRHKRAWAATSPRGLKLRACSRRAWHAVRRDLERTRKGHILEIGAGSGRHLRRIFCCGWRLRRAARSLLHFESVRLARTSAPPLRQALAPRACRSASALGSAAQGIIRPASSSPMRCGCPAGHAVSLVQRPREELGVVVDAGRFAWSSPASRR